MGRKAKVENAVTVSVRLPAKFVESLETKTSLENKVYLGDVLRDILLNGNGHETQVEIIPDQLKEATIDLVNFFFAMFKSGKLSIDDLAGYPTLRPHIKQIKEMLA